MEQVESEAPNVKDAIAAAKAELLADGAPLRMSPARAHELRHLPPAKRSLREECLLLVSRELVTGEEEREKLIVERDLARADAVKSSAELEQVQHAAIVREAQATLLAQEAKATQTGLEARCARQASDLVAAVQRYELLVAKGGAYDELASKAEELARSSQKAADDRDDALRAAEQGRAECTKLSKELTERRHQLELLQADKEYLLREVEALGERAHKAEAEVARLRFKTRALKADKLEALIRLAEAPDEARHKAERHLSQEVKRLEEQAASDITTALLQHEGVREVTA